MVLVREASERQHQDLKVEDCISMLGAAGSLRAFFVEGLWSRMVMLYGGASFGGVVAWQSVPASSERTSSIHVCKSAASRLVSDCDARRAVHVKQRVRRAIEGMELMKRCPPVVEAQDNIFGNMDSASVVSRKNLGSGGIGLDNLGSPEMYIFVCCTGSTFSRSKSCCSVWVKYHRKQT